jgi:hypothetical protein
MSTKGIFLYSSNAIIYTNLSLILHRLHDAF